MNLHMLQLLAQLDEELLRLRKKLHHALHFEFWKECQPSGGALLQMTVLNFTGNRMTDEKRDNVKGQSGTKDSYDRERTLIEDSMSTQ